MKLQKKIKRLWNSWKITRLSQQEVRERSLYPECKQKKLSQIRNELFWLCRNPKRKSFTTTNTIQDYFNMGIDREGENLHDYIFRSELDKARNAKQPASAALLRDKWITARYLDSCGVATTRPLFVKNAFVSTEEALRLLKTSGYTNFFAKLVDGALGKGTFFFNMVGDEFEIDGQKVSGEELAERMNGCIVEPFIEQHEALTALAPGAVSAIRFITICEEGKIDIILAYFFAPASGAINSHTNQGSILLKVDENGELGETGLQLTTNRGKRKIHPDTGIKFKGFKIPYWKEATELAKQAHKCFPMIHSIGWDIAISKNGPLIIEGNHGWGTASFQYVNGPGREFMKKYFLD